MPDDPQLEWVGVEGDLRIRTEGGEAESILRADKGA
jgi:hypothetical protein